MTVYRFDDIRVDTAAFRVERAGRPLALEPKAFDLLVLLLERRGETVSKTEILDTVWRHTAVTDNALTRIVAHLRKALGDDAREARYVETVPTRGYRWRAPVEVGPPAPPRAAPARAGRSGLRAAAASLVALAALAVAGLSLTFRDAPASAPPSPQVVPLWPTQLTTSPRLDAFPALAPGGRAVAYASDRSGAFEIVVKSLAAGGRDVPLTADGQQNVQPAWSPDGEHLAYHSMRRGGIWMVPAHGGDPRRVTDFGSKPAWSPDGRWLAFQSGPLADIAPSAYGANVPSTIWVVRPDGTGLRRVTSPARPPGGHASPAWSPDGRRLAFASYPGARLWSAPVAGGAPSPLFEGSFPLFDPVFAPDGSAVFAATGGPYVVRISLSPGTGEPTGEVDGLATPALAAVRHLSIAADGRRLAVASLSLRSNLWSVPLAGDTGRAAGPPQPLTDDTARRKTWPVFSPDGRWIAYTAARGGAGTDVWVMGAHDGRAQAVTAGDPTAVKYASPSHFRPSWFPDSARLAFLAAEGGRATLQVADLVSRQPRPLFDLGTGPGPPADGAAPSLPAPVEGLLPRVLADTYDYRLSPDGSRVAYSAAGEPAGLPRIYVRSLEGGPARALSAPDRAETYPAWSPDGRWIASEWHTDHGTSLVVRPSSGGPPHELNPGPGQSWVHDWSPDGERVLFAGQRGGVWNVWWVSRTTGREVQVTGYSGVDTFVRYPAAAPGGDRVVYEKGEVRGNIWTALLPDPGEMAGWTSRRLRAP